MNTTDTHYEKMANTPVSKLILKLGLPSIISLLISNIYNLVDSFFIGQLGSSEQGALGVLFVLQLIIQGFAFMLANGSGVYIAGALAKKNIIKASNYVSTAFFLSFALGVIFLIFGNIFLEEICLLLGSTKTILPYAKDYSFWILMASPFLMASLVLNNNLRFEGKALYSMIGLSVGAILNMFGDFIFISVLNMSVFGAGLSTAISQTVSFIILLFMYLTKAQSKISYKYIVFKFSFIFKICKVGFPSFVRQSVAAASNGIVNNLAKPFGDVALAAISIVNKFISLTLCIAFGIAQGFQPVASFNYAIKDYKRVKQALLFTLKLSIIVLITLSIFSFTFAREIIWLFDKSKEVIDIGVVYLRINSITLILAPFSILMNVLFQSIKKPLAASILALVRSGLILVPVVLILTSVLDLRGIQIATGISDVLVFIATIPFLVKFLKKKEEETSIL